MAIPRIMHQIWVGTEPMPDEFVAWGERWKELHPEWEHRLWTEETLPEDVERREVLDRGRIPAERADVLRYELLWRHGGVYVDTDMEPLKPIDDLLENAGDFFIGEAKPGRINNAVFAAAPRHPLLEAAMREARFMDYDDPADADVEDIKHATGPRFFEAIVDRFPEITRLPPHTFYPVDDEQRAQAHAIHHSARTWVSSDPVERERIKFERELAKVERKLRRAERDAAILRKERDELLDLVENQHAGRGIMRVVLKRLYGRMPQKGS